MTMMAANGEGLRHSTACDMVRTAAATADVENESRLDEEGAVRTK
eukprot:CAMPEP_0119558186 /NCGR_PEP_ID=MMETSP1352-20130426/10290_1 /TAXON_ID=265584 /ORGANISM="Stauroneis constricta, Strain CCMP1120" /LENGTH=44 /DNA_ID= /DNA_START= /DNA_END= /DNA_ORIENTATION=